MEPHQRFDALITEPAAADERRVLIVDDDHDFAVSLQGLLGRYRPLVEASGLRRPDNAISR